MPSGRSDMSTFMTPREPHSAARAASAATSAEAGEAMAPVARRPMKLRKVATFVVNARELTDN